MVKADELQRERATLSREANAHILALEARLDDASFLARDPNRHLIGLLCECGCMEIAAVTRSDYERHGGAWKDDHKPAHEEDL